MTDNTTGERTVTGASIRLDGVVKQYKGQNKAAVQKIDLDIEAGHIVAFVGPSGCGKTTTLKMINRLIEPTEGRIFIGDRDVTGEDADKLRQSIGYVIQSGGLFPHWSVAKNIGAIPRVLGWDAKKIDERTDYLLDLVGLDVADVRDRLPKDMSGGQQQRVAIARALVAQPTVIFADEPTGNLDSVSSSEVLRFLRDSVDVFGQTAIMVTHDPIAATYADETILLADGRITATLVSPTVEQVVAALQEVE